MLTKLIGAALAAAVLAGTVAAAQASDQVPAKTALDAYVAQPDPSFHWSVARTFKGRGYHGAVLDLTSQTWSSPARTDRSVWKHWLTVVVPDDAPYDTGMLVVSNGDNDQPAPSKPSAIARVIAVQSHSVVAELGQVPNQPMRFTDSPNRARSEDAILAYQQARFAKTHDPQDIVRLPMVKSASAAMTAVQQYLATPEGGGRKLDKFVVAGASKRGWTTWLTGATDPRVVAIIPIVIDVLNNQVQMRHHWEALGRFSPALGDYVENGIIPDTIGTPVMTEVQKVEDPYFYLDRPALKMPKYLINASGDQFFLPDSSQFYWSHVQEEKRLRYLPNTDHGMGHSDIIQNVIGFYSGVLNGVPRPRYDWRVQGDRLVVTSQDKPSKVVLWRAANPKARDFRLEAIGRAYKATPLKAERDGTYVVNLPKPAAGFTASFVELTYPSGGRFPFVFTTEVVVTPNTLPFDFNKRP